MPVPVLTDTSTSPYQPDQQHPVRLIARNLNQGETLPPHSHPWAQLTYSPQGMLQVTAGGQVWFVPPQRAIWIPPGIPHEVTTLSTARLRVLHIDASHNPRPVTNCEVLEICPLIKELIARMEQLDPSATCERELRISAVLCDEIQAAPAIPVHLPMPSEKRLRAACDWLIAHPADADSLEVVARHAGASARTLNRLFEKELHMSFVQWRQQMRLSLAVPLVAQGLPLSRVAAELGYASQSAFSAMFRKALGVPPGVFFSGHQTSASDANSLQVQSASSSSS